MRTASVAEGKNVVPRAHYDRRCTENQTLQNMTTSPNALAILVMATRAGPNLQDAVETHMEATVLEEAANQTDHRFIRLQR